MIQFINKWHYFMYFVFLGKEEIGADVPIVPVVQVQDVSLRRGAHGQDVPSG